MNDAYVELLVKRKGSLAAMVIRSILYGIGVLGVLVTFLTGGTLFMVFAICFFALGYFVQYNSEIEFEYLYLDKHLTIDRIKNKSKRKKVAEYDLTNLEILAPANSHRMDSFNHQQNITLKDFSTKETDDTPYAMVIRTGTAVEKVLIEVNDELIEQISRTCPRKVFKD